MFGNISQLLEMKKKAEEIKAKLELITITEEYKGITVDCNGNRKILSIHVDDTRLYDKAQLEMDLCEAINRCTDKAEKAAATDMAAMAGGLGSLFGK